MRGDIEAAQELNLCPGCWRRKHHVEPLCMNCNRYGARPYEGSELTLAGWLEREAKVMGLDARARSLILRAENCARLACYLTVIARRKDLLSDEILGRLRLAVDVMKDVHESLDAWGKEKVVQ